jgi:hypothetical protein
MTSSPPASWRGSCGVSFSSISQKDDLCCCSASIECFRSAPWVKSFGPSSDSNKGAVPRRWPLSATTASADFSTPISRCHQRGSLPAGAEISQGKSHLLRPGPAGFTHATSRRLSGVPNHCWVPLSRSLVSGFCSSGPGCRRRLPSDSTSRWTPLPRRAVPITSVRRGVSPPEYVTCLAHKKPSNSRAVFDTNRWAKLDGQGGSERAAWTASSFARW